MGKHSYITHFCEQEKKRLKVEGTLREVEELETPWIDQLGIGLPHIVERKADILADDRHSSGERKYIIQHEPCLFLWMMDA